MMKLINVGSFSVLLCVGLAASLMGSRDADATSAPTLGQSFPQTFIEYKKAHPEKFKVREAGATTSSGLAVFDTTS